MSGENGEARRGRGAGGAWNSSRIADGVEASMRTSAAGSGATTVVGHLTRRGKTSGMLASGRTDAGQMTRLSTCCSPSAAHRLSTSSLQRSTVAVAMRAARHDARSRQMSAVSSGSSSAGNNSGGRPRTRFVAARLDPPVGSANKSRPCCRALTSLVSASRPSASTHPRSRPPVNRTHPSFGSVA